MAKSQDNGSTVLLGLKGYEVEQVRQGDNGIVVRVMSAREKDPSCPRCGGSKLYRHGLSRTRRVLHSWSYGAKIYLEFESHRWRCRECGGSFSAERDLLRPYSRITKQAQTEALWQLRDHSFSQVKRELGVGYWTLRALLERETNEEMLSNLREEGALFLGIDEHSFRHQDMVHTVTEVKKKRVLGVLKDDRISTLKDFLKKIPSTSVKEVCIDMKDSLRKAVESIFPAAKVVLDPFHVVADSNRRMDEARRIEQDVHHQRRILIPKRIFLVGAEKLREEKKTRVDELLSKYPSLSGFYWAKEKIRELYRQPSRVEAARALDNIILNLKAGDDGELIRWGNMLKRWREPILNHFDNRTSNAFTEGCNTKIKMLKRLSYGLRNANVYWRKMLLGFVPSRSYFHTI